MIQEDPLDITPPPSPDEIRRILHLREGRQAGVGGQQAGHGADTGRGMKVIYICFFQEQKLPYDQGFQ